MGCSVTQGIGCYDTSTFDYVPGKPSYEYKNIFDINKKHLDRFLEYSWGSVLQKKLKYDHHFNMGVAGSSTSGQVKLFYENLTFLKSLTDYDVLIVWLLTTPTRFSFYTSGKNLDIIPGNDYTFNYNNSNQWAKKIADSKIDKAYSLLIDDLTIDTLLEQKFYKDIIKETSENLGFKFLYNSSLSGAGNFFMNKFKKMFNETINLSTLSNESLIPCYKKNPELYSVLKCHHPNEKGYEVIGKRFFDLINLYDPNLVNDKTPELYTQERVSGYKIYKLI